MSGPSSRTLTCPWCSLCSVLLRGVAWLVLKCVGGTNFVVLLPRTMYCPFILQPTHALAHRSPYATSHIRTCLRPHMASPRLLHNTPPPTHHLRHTTTTAASPPAAPPPTGPFFSLPIFSLGFQATRHHWNYHTIGQKNLTMQGAHWEHGEGYVPLRCVVAGHRCCVSLLCMLELCCPI